MALVTPGTTLLLQAAAPSGHALELHGSLLQLRGSSLSSSPLIAPASGSALLFNGEVFGGLHLPRGANDAAALMAALAQPHARVPDVLESVHGPWALVFWHAPTATLWFGKDPVGRRSLLTSLVPSDLGGSGSVLAPTSPLLISSLSPQTEEMEGCSVADLAASDAAVLHALRSAVAVRCTALDSQGPVAGPPLVSGGPGFGLPPDATRARSAGTSAVATSPAGASAVATPPATTTPFAQPVPVMILFSGGVDSTLLAALAHEVLPPAAPIDLVSICFDGGGSPDRASALDAVAELLAWAPTRTWRLVAVDCSLEDVDAHAHHLLRLLHPAGTVMDLNIGAALWLAARGRGRVVVGPSGQSAVNYTSPARVVLLGHGADELCGGYGRHRTKFREGGWEGLNEEMALDMRRLWLRNLGRDDRLVADHGRETRHPFLDEGVIDAVLRCPLASVSDLREPSGVGDKRVLRAALRTLGLPRAAGRVKRAIQFGTRIGKLNNIRQFGGTRKANMAHAGSVQLADLGPREGGVQERSMEAVDAHRESTALRVCV